MVKSSSSLSFPVRSTFSKTNFCSIVILFVLACFASAWSQEAKKPEYQGAPGSKLRPAAKVAFVPGPFGADGKVHPVVPDAKARRFPNEVETPQEREANTRAALGISNPTSKAVVRVLSPQELSTLNWAPNILDTAHNPFLNSEQLKPEGETTAFHLTKTVEKSSKPAKGEDFAGFGDTGYFPPDGGIAAGPYQVVEVVNSSINVYDKNGNLLSSQTLNNFFSGLGTPGSDFLYDPSIYYDFISDRFWILATSDNLSANRSNHLVAVSASSDVTQGWYIYYMDATVNGGGSSGNWCDYPHMGMDADAIYISCNMFSFSGNSFQYSKIRILTKSQFTGGGCCSWWDLWNLSDSSGTSFTVRPALERWVNSGFGDFWVNAEGTGGSGNTLKIWQLTNPVHCCDGSSGPTLVGNELGVGSYDSAPAARQPNGVAGLDTGGTRVLFAAYQFGHLSLGQTIASAGGAGAGFTEIDVSSYPTMSAINDWVFSVSGDDIYYPFVDENGNDDKTMVYTRSNGSSLYPGAYFAGIPRSSSCTYCLGSQNTMAAGQANYDVTDSSGRNRWGDYQGASGDPDVLGIWVEGEYVASNNSWAKEINSSYNSYAPIDSPSTPTVAFGNQAVFSTAATQYLTFKNNGNATLYTYSTGITNDTDYHITYDGCAYQTLQSGASCTEGVDFSPTSVGSGTGYLIVEDNTSATYAYTTLTGNGVQAATSTSLGSTPNPSTYGQTVKFTAQVFSSTSGTPTGTVTFYNGSKSLGSATLSGGVATLSTSAIGGASHTITATYGGSTMYLSSSTSITQTVKATTSSTKVTSSQNPSIYGHSVTFTATVTSGVGTPNGTVNFKSGSTSIGTGTLSGGTATLSTSTLTAGTHSITAVYEGNANWSTSTSSAITQTVNKVGTQAALKSSANPSSYHKAVTFTATITSAGGTPQGSVTFKDGTTTLGTTTLNTSGVGSITIQTLSVGTHSITVAYAGNANFLSSTSSARSQVVNKASTTTALTSSSNPSTHGTSVTFTATISRQYGGVATGKVTFKDGSTVLGTGTVGSSNTAAFATSSLSKGTHQITGTYSGDGNFTTSTSSALSQVVQ